MLTEKGSSLAPPVAEFVEKTSLVKVYVDPAENWASLEIAPLARAPGVAEEVLVARGPECLPSAASWTNWSLLSRDVQARRAPSVANPPPSADPPPAFSPPRPPSA